MSLSVRIATRERRHELTLGDGATEREDDHADHRVELCVGDERDPERRGQCDDGADRDDDSVLLGGRGRVGGGDDGERCEHRPGHRSGAGGSGTDRSGDVSSAPQATMMNAASPSSKNCVLATTGTAMAVAMPATSAANKAASVTRVHASEPVIVATRAPTAMTPQVASHPATLHGTGMSASSQVDVALIHAIIHAA